MSEDSADRDLDDWRLNRRFFLVEVVIIP